ncbi:MAG: TonB-dependent receptor [Gemmatimonadota bacterium]|nr:TonB-dependent receptor [Gemmatimonadota bacterium]
MIDRLHLRSMRSTGAGPLFRAATILAALALPALGTWPLVAQEPDSTSAIPLRDLVVSVTRTSQLVGEVPAKVTILSRAEIEASPARTIPDLLRTIPGVTLRDYQSSMATHPTRQAASMRGLGGGTSAGRTVVLLNGMPIADPWGGWVHWARIPLYMVERIEVVRGGAAGVWGSRALGGVINIVTIKAERNGGSVAVEGGELSMLRTQGVLSARSDKAGVIATGEFYRADGFVGVSESLRGPIDEPAGGQHGMGFADMRLDPSTTLGLRLSGGYLDETRDWGTALRDTDLRAGFIRAGADVVGGAAGDWVIDLFGNFQSFRSTFSSETLDRTVEQPSLDQFDVPTTSLGGNVQWSKLAGEDHELTAGADLFWVEGEVNEDFFWADDAFRRRRAIGGEQLLAGVYAQDVFKPNEAWHLLGSVRWDLVSNKGGFRTVRAIDTGDIVSDSTFADETESSVNFTAGVVRELGERASLRANVSGAYRAPTPNELFKPFREPGNVVTESNAGLVAEQAYGAELGVDVMFGRASLLRLTGFWTRVENPIVEATIEEAGPSPRPIAPCGFVPAGGVCRQRQNLGALRTAGIEADILLPLNERWTLEGSYIWNPTEITSAPDNLDLEGKSASRTPEHAVTATVRWQDPSIVALYVSGRYVGPRFEDDLNALDLESFFVLDLRVARTIDQRWDLFLDVENLFDQEYETARPSSGLIRVGAPRVVSGGVRVRW